MFVRRATIAQRIAFVGTGVCRMVVQVDKKKLRTAVCDERLVTVDEPLLDDDIRVVVTALSSDDAS